MKRSPQHISLQGWLDALWQRCDRIICGSQSLWFVRVVLAFCLTLFLCIIPTLTDAHEASRNLLVEPSIAQESVSAEQLDQRARELFEARQYEDAATLFRQAADMYLAELNPVQQALSLSNAALCYRQLGQWVEANAAIAQSRGIFETQLNVNSNHRLSPSFAQVLDIQANLLLNQGQFQYAIETWDQAIAHFNSSNQLDRVTKATVSQSQAYQALGLNRRAIEILETALHLPSLSETSLDSARTALQALPTVQLTITALNSLGEALRTVGDLNLAAMVLQASLTYAQTLNQPHAIASSLFRLGNVERAKALSELELNDITRTQAIQLFQELQTEGTRRDGTDAAIQFFQSTQMALEHYAQAALTTTDPLLKAQSQLNQLSLLVETERWLETDRLLPDVQQQVESLPLSHNGLYAQINLSQTLITLQQRELRSPSEHETSASLSPQAIAQLLTRTIQSARELNDSRAEAYSLGNLGHLYQQLHQLEEAERVTQDAAQLAQVNNASEIAYLWEWQLGQIRLELGDKPGAIAAYRNAVSTLNSIRGDLVALNPSEQFTFRDTIEPIHRQLVSLLLDTQDAAHSISADVSALKEAREVVESLQLAELDNFFRQACLDTNPTLVEQLEGNFAVIYPIILPDQLVVIASLPSTDVSGLPTQPLTQDATSFFCAPDTTSDAAPRTSSNRTYCAYRSLVTQAEVEEIVSQLLSALQQPNDPRSLAPSQALYNWLIRPIRGELNAIQSTQSPFNDLTLVFVLDGLLRNIPMALLNDGDRYLIENYRVSLSPGLQLVNSQPIQVPQPGALVAGLSEARQGFTELQFVNQEVEKIEAEIPEHHVLLNQQFTKPNLEAAIASAPFPIVHLATHGQFGSRLEETYIITWDERLSIGELRNLLRMAELRQEGAIELLVLSACETAAGDNRAALGLAGIAVRSGARSTLATLWQVSDASSASFMGTFYQELIQSGVPKAEAVRRAQLSLLHDSDNPEFQKPYYWASYVLLGAWE